jgi:hypothetical protein
VALGLDADRPALRCEAHRVVDEVEEHLVHALGVGLDRGQVLGQVARERDVAIGARHLDLGHHLCHEGREGHLLTAQGHLAGFEPRQVEQLLDEPAEALGLSEHDLQDLRVRLLHAVEQVLQVRADRRDRRLQLVRDVRHQIAA